MSGDKILQLLQSGYQGCLCIGGFHLSLAVPPIQSQYLRKSLFLNSFKPQLDGPIFFVCVLCSHQAPFNFTGHSGLIARMQHQLDGFAQVKGYWVVDPVALWMLMLSSWTVVPCQNAAPARWFCTSKGLLGCGPSGIMDADAIIMDSGAMHVAGVPIVNPSTVVVWEVMPGPGNGFQATQRQVSITVPHLLVHQTGADLPL
ncbi:hypothetical protein S83_030766 [Arachis hypogaea]